MTSKRKIIDPCDTPSSKSIKVGGDSERLPIDLIIEIFLRLPAKSIARFLCVSKLWSSILCRPDFTELFLTRSATRPQVLVISLNSDDDVAFFTMPQSQNHDEKSTCATSTYVTKTPFRGLYKTYRHVNGLVFYFEIFISKPLHNQADLVSVICNPSTGQSLTMPKDRRKLFLGYDPTEKLYKVLSITQTSCEVLTLGSQNLVWRDILCSTEHYPKCNGICVNGVLYYRAAVNKNSEFSMLVCFDIQSEEFHFMNVKASFSRAVCFGAVLIDYNGKLGSLMSAGRHYISQRSETFELWVLEDLKKHEWSQHIHVVPPSWKDVARKAMLFFVGVIGTDEIVSSHLNYIFYYNIKRNTVVRVEIKGVKRLTTGEGTVFLNHVEDLKLLY